MQASDLPEHHGRVSALAPARCHQVGLGQPVEHGVEHQRLRGARCGQPGPKLAQHRGVKALVLKLQPQQVLPIQPQTHRISGLPVGQPLHVLQHADDRQPPRRLGRASAGSEQAGERLVLEHHAERVTRTHTERTARHHRPHHPRRLRRHLSGITRPQRHHRHQPFGLTAPHHQHDKPD
jgi:hypothetical protein